MAGFAFLCVLNRVCVCECVNTKSVWNEMRILTTSKLKQNTMENLFELMEKYNLTLRRLSDEEVTCYSPIPDRELNDNETLVETIAKSNVSKEEFEKWEKKGYWQSCRFNIVGEKSPSFMWGMNRPCLDSFFKFSIFIINVAESNKRSLTLW